ncbi:MAG: ATP-dependent RNA helicase, partial [Kiritimatiellae bacterium]|nr:ATP-dependent RNA helicase [Kiritimatiellia bacterium]
MAFPVEEKIGEIAAALAANRSVVLTAPPGSGKTTCVAPALLDAPWLAGRKIVMLEPRRLAARGCAAYIARRRGEELGETVGYQVRLERRVSARTRLEIVTEGLLAQRILSDPELSDTGLVIFDEFHERSLACDLAFALALEVRRALRPDLRILVMSATLDAESVAAHLGYAATVRAEGRMYPVDVRYLGAVSVAAAVGRALAETDGDVLCFLPGEGEIRRAMESVRTVAPSAAVLPLHGSLPKEEQDRVFARGGPRKVVLSTSIAETSLTLEGVTAVVDSGLMRVPRFSPG